MKITGKIAVVTGVGAGIGRALALALAEQCEALALSDIDPGKLAATVAACKKVGVKVYAEAFDVADRAAMDAFAANTIEALGKVDIMINNAGVALGPATMDELTIEDFEWVFGINLWGMIYGSTAFLPHLSKQPESALVNISSVFGLMGVSRQVPYCTTKFAIRGFTESLRMEAIDKYPGLQVISVHPGGIDTDIMRSSKWVQKITDSQREQATQNFKSITRSSPEKAAKVILKGIRRNKGRVLIGPDARVVGFLTRFLPSKYIPIVGWRVRKELKDYK